MFIPPKIFLIITRKNPPLVLERGIFSGEGISTGRNFLFDGEEFFAAKMGRGLNRSFRLIYRKHRRVPDRLPASRQKFPCSPRGHRLWSFSSWLFLLCSKNFRAETLKDLVESVKKHQADDQRRAEKSCAERQDCCVLFEKFLHDCLPPVLKFVVQSVEQREV